jgi:N-methylhydantoinase A/oxoprolinase/acetone carboxylase beta subunit
MKILQIQYEANKTNNDNNIAALRKDMELIENKMDDLHESIEDKLLKTDNTISTMKHEVELQIQGMQGEMHTQSFEMKEMNKTLCSLNTLITSLHEKTVGINVNAVQTKETNIEKLDDSNENLIDCKQHGGLRVTRSSNQIK